MKKAKIISELQQEETYFRLLYTTPESLQDDTLRTALKVMHVPGV